MTIRSTACALHALPPRRLPRGAAKACGQQQDDTEDIIEAMRLDEPDVMRKIIDSIALGGDIAYSESGDNGDETTGVGGIAEPSSYAQLRYYSVASRVFGVVLQQ